MKLCDVRPYTGMSLYKEKYLIQFLKKMVKNVQCDIMPNAQAPVSVLYSLYSIN